MAVKSIEDGINKLVLEIDNGDLSKINEVMEKWNFKDYQSFIRFAVSIFLLSDDNVITIKNEGLTKDVGPVPDLLKQVKGQS